MRNIVTLILVAFLTFGVNAITKLPDQGVYKIQNVYSGTYVKLQSNYLADMTAMTAEDASDLLVWYGERDSEGESLLTVLSGDGGDMIETLAFIRGMIEETLEYNNKPTWFLDEMFQLHLVPTGDAEDIVYLCVDVPEIEDWDEIKAIILEAAGGQTAVSYYITHMQPGNRHYMGIDPDGSFGYRLAAATEEGTDIKFKMYRQSMEGGYCFVKTASTTSNAPYLRRVHSKYSTIDLTAPHGDASAVFELNVTDNRVSKLAVQGLDLAPLATAIGNGAYLAMCETNTVADKFVYGNYALKLQLPDEGVTADAVLAAAAQVLSEDSELYKDFSNHSEWLKDRAAIYFVHGNDGALEIANDNNYAEYADLAKWKLEFIDTEDNYFAPEATVVADGLYYTTLYAAFPYYIVNPENVVAYTVTEVDETGVPVIAAINSEIIAAGTPVLLECATQNATDNMLMPVSVAEPAGAPRTTTFVGTYFDDDTANDKVNMLTLHEGLLFAADTALDFMPANKAWVNKDITTAITDIVTDNAKGDNTIYDLMGRKVNNPTHGIYIQNGKKVVL